MEYKKNINIREPHGNMSIPFRQLPLKYNNEYITQIKLVDRKKLTSSLHSFLCDTLPIELVNLLIDFLCGEEKYLSTVPIVSPRNTLSRAHYDHNGINYDSFYWSNTESLLMAHQIAFRRPELTKFSFFQRIKKLIY